ncbi:MAG TPA: VOC family protein [Solirubrobacteraceae bacterium]|nr:VOC family protein [Solirubrobacteraceae bacterium]
MTETQTASNITQIGTVMVPVSDQDRAIAFYCEKLGMEKRADSPFGHGERWVEVAPAGAGTTLALVKPREGEPIGIDTHVAFSTKDIDADHAGLLAGGVDVDAEVMRMGDPVPPMFWLRDADGNRLMIVQTS